MVLETDWQTILSVCQIQLTSVPIRHMSVTRRCDLMIQDGVTPRFLPTNRLGTYPEEQLV
jgi:hypothetical protein